MRRRRAWVHLDDIEALLFLYRVVGYIHPRGIDDSALLFRRYARCRAWLVRTFLADSSRLYLDENECFLVLCDHVDLVGIRDEILLNDPIAVFPQEAARRPFAVASEQSLFSLYF